MSLRRGDIVQVAVKGPYASKPRPAVVIQATETLDPLESVTVRQVTSVHFGAPCVRVAVASGRRSGLDRDSWIVADKVVTVPRAAPKSTAIGKLDAVELSQLEAALRTWLDL